jgi:flavin reductase (DIM6/NTAB) family NADH-FMN oxidoreductase RutF
VGVKVDETAHEHITESSVFSINVIGKKQKNLASTFFKTHDREGNAVAGEEFEEGSETGSSLFLASPSWRECPVMDNVVGGDHTVFLGEVVEAGVRREDQTILMRDHGLNYGG